MVVPVAFCAVGTHFVLHNYVVNFEMLELRRGNCILYEKWSKSFEIHFLYVLLTCNNNIVRKCQVFREIFAEKKNWTEINAIHLLIFVVIFPQFFGLPTLLFGLYRKPRKLSKNASKYVTGIIKFCAIWY